MKTTRLLALATLVAAPLAAQTSAASTPSDSVLMQRGRNLTTWLLAGQADSVLAHMTTDTHAKVGGRDGVLSLAGKLASQLGAEADVVDEKLTRSAGTAEYRRQSRFDVFVDEPIVFMWRFDATGKVDSARIAPASQVLPATP